ncbi:MAG TPA: hypothetical protein DDW54_02955 [Clostridiales bacterium]|nr:hypothetical protein [Clostridiales bacterium]
MVKLWIKTLKGDKILKNVVVEKDEKFTYADFQEYISEGCYSLDEASPVVIKSHIMSFAKYNIVFFKPSDFIESVDFDKMSVENLLK